LSKGLTACRAASSSSDFDPRAAKTFSVSEGFLADAAEDFSAGAGNRPEATPVL
jgi:hypothetical protein